MSFVRQDVIRAAVVAAAIAVPSLAGAGPQPHNNTPAATVALGRLLFEIDYATAGVTQSSAGIQQVDTIVSIGLGATATAQCDLQVAWFDWNNAPVGFSGDGLGVISKLAPGETLEFTTASNAAAPFTYYPFDQNVFRSTAMAFEGHAQILTDCPSTVKIRADAEFATLTIPAAGGAGTVAYKPINISRPAGIVGY